MGLLILHNASFDLETRRKRKIETALSRAAPDDGAYAEQKARSKEFPNAKRRGVGPCNTYNCHGLTFAARRSAIWKDIENIIHDDDYQQIKPSQVLPGDIVIYCNSGVEPGSIKGDMEHSGIALGKNGSGVLMVLSKWGVGDEWVHAVGDSPYDNRDIRYFRINDCPDPSKN